MRQPSPCDPGAMQRQAMLCVPKLRLHPSRCISTSHFISTYLIWAPRPRTILYYKACTKHFPVLLCKRLSSFRQRRRLLLTSSHLFVTHLYSSVCRKTVGNRQKLLCTNFLFAHLGKKSLWYIKHVDHTIVTRKHPVSPTPFLSWEDQQRH